MKKALLFFAALPFFALCAYAQMPYNVTVLTGQTYQPLTGGTSMNGAAIWDEETFTAPIGFLMRIGNDTTSVFYSETSIPGCTTDSTGIANGFSFMDADLADRGIVTGTQSLSPIRYTLTGNAGSRIFKCEYFNAGFADEYNNTGHAYDSVNFQVWYYEGTNVVELRYGPSQISNTGYFNFGNGPIIGYGNNVDFTNISTGTIYYLSGSPTSPTIDSLSLPPSAFPVPISSYPANGTVYRFTPNHLGIDHLALADVSVYPTAVNNTLHINNGNNSMFDYNVVGVSGVATNVKGIAKQGANNIDISVLAPGMYLLQLRNDNGSGIYKFIKL
ncbi:T9SS type A sorting domain-containing protein [Chitinophagaceae bacterium MMS25-I14]